MSVILNPSVCTSLRISDRIDSNDCPRAADLSENGCTRISKNREAVVFEKSVVSQSNLERRKEDIHAHRHDDTCGANQNARETALRRLVAFDGLSAHFPRKK